MIANFVMIILLVEMANVLSLVFTDRCRILSLFKMENNCSDSFILSFVEKDILSCITAQIYIPILCLFVKVLWLTYLHSPYKYCFIKWVVYMIVKILAILIVSFSTHILSEMYGYSHKDQIGFYIAGNDIESTIFYLEDCIPMLFEYVYYLKYSRTFYLLLKGIELENKLSLDRKKYLDSKFVRVHFKVATILVATALFFRFIVSIPVTHSFTIKYLIELFTNNRLSPELEYILQGKPVSMLFAILYRVLWNLNYLYMFSVILLQYYKKRNNRNINDRIRPLVRAYQDRIFTSRVNYTKI